MVGVVYVFFHLNNPSPSQKSIDQKSSSQSVTKIQYTHGTYLSDEDLWPSTNTV